MKKSHDISVTLCGIALGLIMGVGAVGTARTAALGASVRRVSDVRFHQAPTQDQYRQYNLNKRSIPLRNENTVGSHPTVHDAAGSSASSVMPSGAVTLCDAVQIAVGKIRRVYDMTVPNTLKNTEIRQKMESSFTEAVDAQCPAVGSSSSAVSAASAASGFSNHCEKYGSRTIRYTQCKIYEKNGKVYTGK